MSSKIKVDTIENVAGSGNVSLGSGHNLVVPGNITGQGTTTLTGDLAVDTNVLKVDTSNNRVGINTTSPSNDLHISSTNPVIRLQDTSTNAYAQIFTNDAGSMRLRADAGNSQASSNFILEIDGTTQLTVDSSGRVILPSQPSFRAGMTANQTVGNAATVTYQTTDHNIGNHFDTSSNVGRFTCPVAGRYLFGIAMGDGNNQGVSGIFALCKNGSRYYDFMEGGLPSGVSGHYEKHGSVVVNAAANDYFDIRQISGGNKALEGTSDGLSTRNRFWGHMLG